MSRYIDADAIIEHLEKDPLFSLVERYGITNVIKEFPTADVVPMKFHERCMELEIKKRANMVERKQGKWLFSKRLEDVYDLYGMKSWAVRYRCSNCNFSTEFIENHNAQYRYCPQCGVCMRGDNDVEQDVAES